LVKQNQKGPPRQPLPGQWGGKNGAIAKPKKMKLDKRATNLPEKRALVQKMRTRC